MTLVGSDMKTIVKQFEFNDGIIGDELVSDASLAGMLRRYISTRHKSNSKVKNIRLCGSQVLKHLLVYNNVEDYKPAVFVVSNGTTAHFLGSSSCHSSWACPVCSPKVMAEYGSRIASLIDARAKWEDKYACMVTFTLPHISYMSLKDSLTILQKTWRMFSRDGNRAKGSNGKRQGVYGLWRKSFDITSVLRVYEVTYSDDNGWHPHIHALFWAHKEDFKYFSAWENDFCDRWFHCARHCAANLGHQDQFIDYLYADYKKRSSDHATVFFSKNADGSIRIVKSSHYISGWSGDKEVTASSFKDTKQEGHYTPWQMLRIAYNTNDPSIKEKYLELFVEYATATHGHRRVQLSPGDNKLINKWRSSNDYVKTLKKILTDKVANQKIICWFSEKQWSQISILERQLGIDIKASILHLARLPDGSVLIEDFLLQYGINIMFNGKHPQSEMVESRYHFFGNAAEEQSA